MSTPHTPVSGKTENSGFRDCQSLEEESFLNFIYSNNLLMKRIHLKISCSAAWPTCRILSYTLAIPKAKQVKLGTEI